MDYKRLGTRIREERKRLNLTQAQLAEAIGASDTYMGAIEREERSLTLDTLVRLVNRLGVTVDYLLADSVTDSDTNIMCIAVQERIGQERPDDPVYPPRQSRQRYLQRYRSAISVKTSYWLP